jgi:ATP-dependent DNA ligase
VKAKAERKWRRRMIDDAEPHCQRARAQGVGHARRIAEGIVSKREGSFYGCGRSRNWLKAKNSDFVRT